MRNLQPIAAAVLAVACGAVQAQAPRELPPVQHQPRAGGSAIAGGNIQAPPLPANRALTPVESQFIQRAATVNRAEILAGRMALARSADPAVRELAEEMVEDHRAANVQLAQIARARGMVLPEMVSPRQQIMLNRLRRLTGEAFDEAFLDLAGVRAHQRAIALFERQLLRDFTDRALRNYAQQTLPMLQRHLQAALTLHAGLGVGLPTAPVAAAPALTDPAEVEELLEAREDIRDAVQVVQRMKADADLLVLMERARGIFIVNDYGRAALGVGVQGGEGVLVTRDATGEFGNPVFYNLGGISVGPQAGAAAGEVAFLLMTDRAVQQFRSADTFSLNADAGLVVGPYSARGHASAGKVQDVVVWSSTGGAYAGVSLGLTGITFDREANWAYYGRRDATPVAILGGRVVNPHNNTLARVLAI